MNGKWKRMAVFLVIAFLLSVSPAVLADDELGAGDMTLTDMTERSATQAVARYFGARNAYLLGEQAAMDWSVTGIVNDEAAHKSTLAAEGITLTSLNYTLSSLDCFDSFAEATVTETVCYTQDGAAKTETVTHMLRLYTDVNGVPAVAADGYLEQYSGFKSCSYVSPEVLNGVANTTQGGALCIVDVALGEVGYQETGNDITEYGRWFGMNGEAWCIMFIAWCANQAQIPTTVIPKAAGQYTMMEHFIDQGRWYASSTHGGTYTPVPGDIIITSNDEGNPSHGGIVERVENGVVWIVDGNWGNRVQHRSYSLTASDIVGYGNPEHSFAMCYDISQHWRVCRVCGIEANRESHDLYLINQGTRYKCRTCGYIVPQVPINSLPGKWPVVCATICCE